MNDEADKHSKVTVFTIIASLFAGWFGVQNNKNRERDFTHGKASTFIYAGIIFLVLFVLGVWGIVQLVMSTAGS
ncbi:MAG: DUF2970 domain-containing protein [Gammaproteobacteria bacterium]|jgi:hypothetical protein